jgi:hypothetical protein
MFVWVGVTSNYKKGLLSTSVADPDPLVRGTDPDPSIF